MEDHFSARVEATIGNMASPSSTKQEGHDLNGNLGAVSEGPLSLM